MDNQFIDKSEKLNISNHMPVIEGMVSDFKNADIAEQILRFYLQRYPRKTEAEKNINPELNNDFTDFFSDEDIKSAIPVALRKMGYPEFQIK